MSEQIEKSSVLIDAKSQWEYIKNAVEIIDGADTKESEEKIEELQADILEVSIRSEEWTHYSEELKPTEYRILLVWGGPAIQVTGKLDENHEPETAELQYQDWSTPWTKYTEADEKILLQYARCFYFGE